jgi:hypothetical protein
MMQVCQTGCRQGRTWSMSDAQPSPRKRLYIVMRKMSEVCMRSRDRGQRREALIRSDIYSFRSAMRPILSSTICCEHLDCATMPWLLRCENLLGLRLNLEACEMSISFDAILSLPVAAISWQRWVRHPYGKHERDAPPQPRPIPSAW